ncbi:DUF3965 domain-containing protein [Ectobacillus panaciterrae]|uniref:DUF3965 domain-containing protein n=1 Tax=Ectobacillus panaciterrae TaxID=363872 RepID=UPI00040953B5|nr:DUF3965 domain-containing protein [Ectobacillus panaciterrae]
MGIPQQEPNWSLVTDYFACPETFTDLLSLLIPEAPHQNEERRTLLMWKEREFYKKENIASFIHYGIKKIPELPKFHKDELPTILRIVRLYQEIGWYEAAYQFMEEQKLIQFVHTSIEQDAWDILTQTAAWNYLIVKRKVSQIDERDHRIWEKVKFNQEWMKEYKPLLSHKEILEFTFLYICRQAKGMAKEELEENLMELAMYCNTFIDEIYKYKLIKKYAKCIAFLEKYCPNRAVIACQRAVIAQIADIFPASDCEAADDFLSEVTEILEYMDFQFSCKYEYFISKLISYIPFFEMIQVPKQVYYFEEMMYLCKGIGYKEQLLRAYVFSQLSPNFISFMKPFIYNKRYETIHEMLFYWCTAEERAELEGLYNLHKIYEMYAYG